MQMSEAARGPVLRGLYAITPDETDTARLRALTERVLAGKPALLQYRNKLAGPALRREQALAAGAVEQVTNVVVISARQHAVLVGKKFCKTFHALECTFSTQFCERVDAEVDEN